MAQFIMIIILLTLVVLVGIYLSVRAKKKDENKEQRVKQKAKIANTMQEVCPYCSSPLDEDGLCTAKRELA